MTKDEMVKQALNLCVRKKWRQEGQGLNEFNDICETALEEGLCQAEMTPDELQFLLDAGADPNLYFISESIADQNYPALYWAFGACNYGYPNDITAMLQDRVKVLLENGADPYLMLQPEGINVFQASLSEYYVDHIIFCCNDEYGSLWKSSDQSIKTDIEIMESLAKKYDLPSVDHFWIAYNYMEQSKI